MSTFLTAAFYKFVDLPDFRGLQAPLLAFCEAHDVKGTILLAREGINSTIAGPVEGVRAVLAYLRKDQPRSTASKRPAASSPETSSTVPAGYVVLPRTWWW